MYELHDLCYSFLMSGQLTEVWMGWGGRTVGWEVTKTPTFRATMTPTGTHTMAHTTLVGHKDVQSAVGEILGPHHLISILH